MGDPLPSFAPGYLHLTAAQLNRLPIKRVSPDEVYERMRSWYWCGPYEYPRDFPILPGEVGYDREARYVETAEMATL